MAKFRVVSEIKNGKLVNVRILIGIRLCTSLHLCSIQWNSFRILIHLLQLLDTPSPHTPPPWFFNASPSFSHPLFNQSVSSVDTMLLAWPLHRDLLSVFVFWFSNQLSENWNMEGEDLNDSAKKQTNFTDSNY